MNGKKVVGNGGKATLPNGKKLSDKIQENKKKNNVTNNKNANKGKKDNSDKTANKTKNNDNKEKKEGKDSQGNKGGTAQEIGKEAARAALKKAAATVPYTRWIPQNIRDNLIDRFMDSDAGEEAVQKGLRSLRVGIILIIVAAVASIVLSLLSFVALYSMIAAPVGWIKDALGKVGDWFASFGHWFIGDGWCPNEGECQNLAYKEYYDKLTSAVKTYSGSCEINEDLITATIFYGQMASEEKIESDTNSEDKNQNTNDETFYYNYLDVSEAAGRQSAKSQVNDLINVYLKGESLTESQKEQLSDDSLLEYGDSDCAFNALSYRDYLIKTYIGWAYPSVIETNGITKEEIADEILKMGGVSGIGSPGGEIIVGAGQAGAIPNEILSNCTSPLGTQKMTHNSCYGYYSKEACEEKDAGSHNGVDIGSAVVDPKIYSIADGTVTTVNIYNYTCPADVYAKVICPGCPKTTGNSVTVKHSIDVDGKTYVFYSEYMHLKSISVRLGQKVSKGEQIGIMGNTGCSTGKHLHFNMLDGSKKRYNPEELLQFLNLPVRSNCNDVRNYCYNHQLSLRG